MEFRDFTDRNVPDAKRAGEWLLAALTKIDRAQISEVERASLLASVDAASKLLPLSPSFANDLAQISDFRVNTMRERHNDPMGLQIWMLPIMIAEPSYYQYELDEVILP